jgi:hypothetical protein
MCVFQLYYDLYTNFNPSLILGLDFAQALHLGVFVPIGVVFAVDCDGEHGKFLQG